LSVPQPRHARTTFAVSEVLLTLHLCEANNIIRYYSTTAGTTLNRKYPDNPDGEHTANRFTGKAVEDHGRHIIIASEPSTYKESEWHLIPRNSLVTASAEHGVEVAPIAYKKEWNAEDPTVQDGK
jgi:predicted glutamine amidotransferase